MKPIIMDAYLINERRYIAFLFDGRFYLRPLIKGTYNFFFRGQRYDLPPEGLVFTHAQSLTEAYTSLEGGAS